MFLQNSVTWCVTTRCSEMLRLFSFIFSLIVFVKGARWHSSQVTLTRLYDLQMEHFDVFQKYLDLEVERLEELKSYLVATKERRYNNFKISYFHNHVNAFKMMTSICYQLRKVEDLMSNTAHSTEALNAIDKNKDLSGDHITITCQGIRRLQKFYVIPAADMAAGVHENRTIGDQMSACECFVMSKYCFDEQDMYGVAEWTIEAYNRWRHDGQPYCVDIETLNFYLIASSVCTGLDLTTLLSPYYSEDTEKFKQFFLINYKNMNFLENGTLNLLEAYNVYYNFRMKIGEQRFRELCKEREPLQMLSKDLKCRYETRNSSFRVLMPFKEEDLSNDPYIKLYHDVLYDDEIAKFKKISVTNMKDSIIVHSSGAHELHENIRSGQVSWLDRYEFEDHLDIIDDRIESFSGFSTFITENYQIVNYGLGGHFEPHYDSFLNTFMNDVQNNGHTVFPLLDIISPSEKGAALVWENLKGSNGDREIKSLHGACPILKGNKWILNLWLYEAGQQLAYDWRLNFN